MSNRKNNNNYLWDMDMNFLQRIKELDNQEDDVQRKWLSYFKDGVANGLIDGRRADNTTNAYKQGYDFGLWLHSEIEETNE